ncbi:hypothetical protein UFOVP225_100 [uncultured Caudovirales phage]|uniref:Uncharacterized protein n=1 Tax=uncultured Caudovirales phage TaxID=2100421 RepID=A0A6J7WX13_9CAUD|nr:hypothetical protein UFOVP113_113 [uncultured Caudovirales phage]CAB5219633.1 hypothetical protein UFOVP225_100 [uncultured Caudovirales phage]
MDQPKSKFPTMGNSAATTAKNGSAEGTSGKLVKKGNTASGDPAAQKKGVRSNVKHKSGAAYGIKTSMPSWKDPQIGPTQGNGRLFTAALNRTKPNFDAGIVDHD